MNRRTRHAIAAAPLAALLAVSAPGTGAARAQSEPDRRERAEELAREGMERIVRALEMLMQSIPQYELPEVNDQGDIIIRRRRPPEGEDSQPPAPEREPDSTDT